MLLHVTDVGANPGAVWGCQVHADRGERQPQAEEAQAAFAFNLSRDIGKRRTTVLATHGIQLDGSRFWVTHRRKTYGPFDYEWSSDFCGVVMLYDGQPFGEYCSLDELYADLKPFSLPMSVVRVTSIVMGCVLFGILNGLCEAERCRLVETRLHQHGFERFLVVR